MANNKKRKTITICSSASFYRHAVDIQAELERRGFTVLIPYSAERMKERGDFVVHKTWLTDVADWDRKTDLMKRHFSKVMEGDCVLVLNYEKNGIPNYIGGNVLMEMALAFHHRKLIYVLNPVTPVLPVYEEVMGMQPIFLNGDVQHLV